MSDTQTTLLEIQSQLKLIVSQMNAQNVQLEEMKNALAAKDLKTEEQTKLIRDMLIKQDIVCIDTLTVQKGSINGGVPKTKAKAKAAAVEDDGEFSDIKLSNVREFFKSMFVHNRKILMVREYDDEFKENYGITQNGFLTAEIIDLKYDKDKNGLEKHKTTTARNKALANKLYADLDKDDKTTIGCMKSEFHAFKEKRKIINLQIDDDEPDVDAVPMGSDEE